MGITRRIFLRDGALAMVGSSAVPAFLTRALFAEPATSTAQGKRLVVIFQRGAADGLNIVVPYAEKHYYAMRPTIAIPQNQVLDLDGFFGLHPSLGPFDALYRQGYLAIVPAAGSPDKTRSHFDAQDYMESGTPGDKSTADGWLNRALQSEDLCAAVRHGMEHSAFRAIALGSQLPRTLAGKVEATAIGNVLDFSVGGRGPVPAQSGIAFQTMYDESSDSLLHTAGESTFEAVKMLRATDPAHYVPAAGAVYPSTPFGNGMKQIAQLMKANLGVETAFTDIGGWDTHHNQGGVNGDLANRLKDFSEGISAFWRDMGDDAEKITLVTMSEFGRTAEQNGTGGTDHGHANAMFVLGGSVKGGKVYGKWPGLAKELLNESRDLVVTTDFRQVLAETITGTLGPTNLNTIFPGAQLRKESFLGLI
ncbi:MAG: DUF1501 domain-containing protein [Terracidiphilus sp.]|jgi:uncharacterized protein (DUF1501 family)